MGRKPHKEIDPDQVADLAKKFWSPEQIAAHFGVHRTTIERRFAQVIEDAKQKGCAILIDEMWRRGFQEKNERVFIHMLNRYLGPIPTRIEITREQAIEFLQKDAIERGLITVGDSEKSPAEEEKLSDQ